ncbi:hypothetical protein SUGI_0113290 [Cryptomeria japonica]|nr:hypothetical protein SUGI_0113290 [Cryptomeria japonica]
MDLSSESDGDISESETREYEEKSYEDLVKGNHIIKNMDGTLRCPFYRGKKKQDYRYNDLLQHASSVGAGKRDLSIELHQQAKRLADRQKLESEIERLESLIEAIKVKDGSSLDHFKG